MRRPSLFELFDKDHTSPFEDGAVKRVDMYDTGRTAVASVTIAGREQQLICDLPRASTGVIDRLMAKNVAIDVHQPESRMTDDGHRNQSK